jgi:hypothetical protein
MMAFLLILATWALWMGMSVNRWYWWIIFSISAALAQYTQNLAIFYLLPLALTPLIARQWKAVRNAVLAGLLATFLYFPWLMQLPKQFSKIQQDYWTMRPSISRLATTLLSFTTNLPIPTPWLPLALFITVLLFILAVWQTILAFRKDLPGAKRGLWMAYLGFAPAILLFIISQWQPIYIERALLPSGICFLIWIGWMLTQTHIPRSIQSLVIGLLLVGFGMGFYQHIYYRGFPYAPYPQLVQSLEKSVSPGDAVVHSNKLTMLPATYYDRSLKQVFLSDPPGSGSDTLALPTQEVLGLYAVDSVADSVSGAKRVWLVIFVQAIREYQAIGYATHPQLAWLQQHYTQQSLETWGDVRLYEFSR